MMDSNLVTFPLHDDQLLNFEMHECNVIKKIRFKKLNSKLQKNRKEDSFKIRQSNKLIKVDKSSHFDKMKVND